MTLNQLMKNLSWIKTDELNNNNNCVDDFINSFNLKYTEFREIKKKDCLCIY